MMRCWWFVSPLELSIYLWTLLCHFSQSTPVFTWHHPSLVGYYNYWALWSIRLLLNNTRHAWEKEPIPIECWLSCIRRSIDLLYLPCFLLVGHSESNPVPITVPNSSIPEWDTHVSLRRLSHWRGNGTCLWGKPNITDKATDQSAPSSCSTRPSNLWPPDGNRDVSCDGLYRHDVIT